MSSRAKNGVPYRAKVAVSANAGSRSALSASALTLISNVCCHNRRGNDQLLKLNVTEHYILEIKEFECLNIEFSTRFTINNLRWALTTIQSSYTTVVNY